MFRWPTFSEVFARIWCLRRLIAFCTVMPLPGLILTSAIGFGALEGTSSLLGFLIALAAVFTIHATLFPKAYQEALLMAMMASIGIILAPVLGGSIFLWTVFVLVSVWVVLFRQDRFLGWAMATKAHKPIFRSKVTTRAPLEDARAWFPLKPDRSAGHYHTGPENADGIFPVWMDIDAPESTEPSVAPTNWDDGPISFYARIDSVEGDCQKTTILDGPEPNAPVQAIVEYRLKATRSGTIVEETEWPTEYPWMQSLTLWLNDFARDGLAFRRDQLEGKLPSTTVRAAHQSSLLMLLGNWFARRMEAKYGGDLLEMSEIEISAPDLDALLERLGSNFKAKGYSEGDMPLVTLDEFFDGNGDESSFQGGDNTATYAGLSALLARADVADIRMGVTQWDGPGTWPLAEYIYLITSAEAETVEGWLKDAGILASEISSGEEHGPRDALEVPADHRVVWAWID